MCILIWINRDAVLPFVSLTHKTSGSIPLICLSWHRSILNHASLSYPVQYKIGFLFDTN